MCGRTACSRASVEQARREIGLLQTVDDGRGGGGGSRGDGGGRSSDANASRTVTGTTTSNACSSSFTSSRVCEYGIDNWNLSPGMEASVLHIDHKSDMNMNNNIKCTQKVWGLVPKSGTPQNPLPEGPSKHYSNLMFNARSDTLYEKNTFRNLLLRTNTSSDIKNITANSDGSKLQSQSCIWPIDGFYEWKKIENDTIMVDRVNGSGSTDLTNKEYSKKKQPYYVHRNDGRALFIPGLWTSVHTGRKIQKDPNSVEEVKETLDTFTILTTDATSSLRWLHHRQPIILDDEQLAREWLLKPTKDLLDRMIISSSMISGRGVDDVNANKTSCSNSTKSDCKSNFLDTSGQKKRNEKCLLTWHPVSKKMSSINYRNKDCVDAIKIEKIPSIKSFFSKATTTCSKHKKTSGTGSSDSSGSNCLKRNLDKNKQSILSHKKSKISRTENSKKRNFFQNHYKVKGNDEKRAKTIHGSILEKNPVPIRTGTEESEAEIIDMTLVEDRE